MSAFIAYLRVSTQKQGESGLGLDAQRAAIVRHVASGTLLETFIEVESGKRSDRPQLALALERAKTLGATLVVAKLDRLARDVAFIANLMKAGVDFVACDMPHANRLTLHILAAVAEDEARRISERTRAALEAARARGVKLGGDRGNVPSREVRAKAQAARQANAAARLARLAPLIHGLRQQGISAPKALANALNERGIVTARGSRWQPVQVSRVLASL